MTPAELFEPVETELGEHVRQVALVQVQHRVRVLMDRAHSRQLSQPERAESVTAARVLETLQSMAPVAALRPARAKGMLALGAAL